MPSQRIQKPTPHTSLRPNVPTVALVVTVAVVKPANSSKSILLFTTSWEILKSCPLQRGADTHGGDDDNDDDGDWWTTSGGIMLGGGYCFCRPPAPVLCKKTLQQLAKTCGNTSDTQVFLPWENNNHLGHFNAPLDSNLNNRMLSEGRDWRQAFNILNQIR